jgi:hypothetical protein
MENNQSFGNGLGFGLGVILFLLGVVGWFTSRKIGKYDKFCNDLSEIKTEIAVIKEHLKNEKN